MLDQAPEFSGKVIAALCDLLGVAKIRTSAITLRAMAQYKEHTKHYDE